MNPRFADLTEIAGRFATDKGGADGDCHLYTELYAACFEAFRLEVFSLLELGLLRAPSSAEEADPASRKVGRIPSVDMWLEYFPNARIHGFDLADFSELHRPRFQFSRGDLSDDSDLDRLARSVSAPRIIIDDASHASFHQQRAFVWLFPILEGGGFYVIEDLHYAPPFVTSLPLCRPMAEIVTEFLDSGFLRLDVVDASRGSALAAQIEHTFLHCSARGRHDWGPKLVIFQKKRRPPDGE